MLNKKLIVSHYEKNLDWLANIHNTIDIQVFCKTHHRKRSLREDLSYPDNINYTTLPNVGREPHTYFHYIIENYDSLPDVAIFSQDAPHEHVLNWNDVVNGSTVLWNTISKQIIGGNCWFFSTEHDLYNCPAQWTIHWGDLSLTDLNIELLWNMLFESPVPDLIEFVPACHLSITREYIQRRPLTFYKKMLTILESERDPRWPIRPWLFERLMPYIFNPDYIIKED